MSVLRSGETVLIGTNAGHYGGSLYAAGRAGSVQVVVPENVQLAFRMGGQVYVVTGYYDSMFGFQKGDLWVIGEDRRVVRRVRLPGVMTRIAATDRHVLIIETVAGDVAVREDGRLVDPASLDYCDGEGRD